MLARHKRTAVMLNCTAVFFSVKKSFFCSLCPCFRCVTRLTLTLTLLVLLVRLLGLGLFRFFRFLRQKKNERPVSRDTSKTGGRSGALERRLRLYGVRYPVAVEERLRLPQHGGSAEQVRRPQAGGRPKGFARHQPRQPGILLLLLVVGCYC